ncbi:MAG: LLM class oxidoreductase [Rhizobiaceae bacterium]
MSEQISMTVQSKVTQFAPLNRAYNSVFHPGRLSLGLVVPLEAYPQGPVPTMADHLKRARLAEELGFTALWLRDVPFNVPTFGDAGQTYDPFVYLGYLAAQTSTIALGVASIILPLRHPAHVAKAAASADVLSDGRLLLGVASGDRPEEYPAMNMDYESRGERFRDSFDYIRQMGRDFPAFDTAQGQSHGTMDMLPKPTATGGRLPMLVTGGSRQHPDWVAEHSNGWITYPRDTVSQSQVIADYRARVYASGQPDKPVSQSLYVDLVDDKNARPQPIHLGFRSNIDYLRSYLLSLQEIGVNHVALNLRLNQAGTEQTMQAIADEILPLLAN